MGGPGPENCSKGGGGKELAVHATHSQLAACTQRERARRNNCTMRYFRGAFQPQSSWVMLSAQPLLGPPLRQRIRQLLLALAIACTSTRPAAFRTAFALSGLLV